LETVRTRFWSLVAFSCLVHDGGGYSWIVASPFFITVASPFFITVASPFFITVSSPFFIAVSSVETALSGADRVHLLQGHQGVSTSWREQERTKWD